MGKGWAASRCPPALAALCYPSPLMSEPSDKRYVLLVASLASFQAAFMGSSVNIALPTIGQEFQMSAVAMGWIATSYLLAAAVGFAVQNLQPVALRYYFGWVSVSLPLFLWGFLFFLIGLILAGLVGFSTKLRLLTKIRQGKKTIADLERRRNSLK